MNSNAKIGLFGTGLDTYWGQFDGLFEECCLGLFEFGARQVVHVDVIMAKTPEDFIERSMDELLPFGFGPSNVAGNKAVEE